MHVGLYNPNYNKYYVICAVLTCTTHICVAVVPEDKEIRRTPQSGGFILWAPSISTLHVIVIKPVAADTFHSGPKMLMTERLPCVSSYSRLC